MTETLTEIQVGKSPDENIYIFPLQPALLLLILDRIIVEYFVGSINKEPYRNKSINTHNQRE